MKENSFDIKDKIVKIAMTLFSKVGYQQASLGTIASKLNRTKPVIYYYFKSKEELYLAVMENFLLKLRKIYSVPEDGDKQSGNSVGLLKKFLFKTFEFCRSNHRYLNLFLQLFENFSLLKDKRISKLITEIHTPLFETMKSFYNSNRNLQRISFDSFKLIILALLLGTLILIKIDKSIDIKKYVDDIITLFNYGKEEK